MAKPREGDILFATLKAAPFSKSQRVLVQCYVGSLSGELCFTDLQRPGNYYELDDLWRFDAPIDPRAKETQVR
jgi:hypothetical protein